MMCIALGLVLTLVAGPTREWLLGPWLESVRSGTLADHLDLVESGTPIDSAIRIDDDDDVLEAYNRMLAGLHDPNQDSRR